MDKKAQILKLLPIKYENEQKNTEMVNTLIGMCEGKPELLIRYLRRWKNELFDKEIFQTSVYPKYKRTYSNFLRYSGKSDHEIFLNITQGIFEQATGKCVKRNKNLLRVLRSLISRQGWIPVTTNMPETKVNKNGQIRLAF